MQPPSQGQGREGWLSKAQEAAASTGCGQGPRGKENWHWGLGPRADGGKVGIPPSAMV